MKTADLNRSKRLKELGWKQEGFFYWFPFGGGVKGWQVTDHKLDDQQIKGWKHYAKENKDFNFYLAPTAGEMIEWLLGEGFMLEIKFSFIGITNLREGKAFETKDGLCNALADAVIWVLERKNK